MFLDNDHIIFWVESSWQNKNLSQRLVILNSKIKTDSVLHVGAPSTPTPKPPSQYWEKPPIIRHCYMRRAYPGASLHMFLNKKIGDMPGRHVFTSNLFSIALPTNISSINKLRSAALCFRAIIRLLRLNSYGVKIVWIVWIEKIEDSKRFKIKKWP